MFQRVDLLELPLPYENDTFDVIFIRCMMDVLPDEQWDVVLQELVRIMKKGAYIECLETYPALVDVKHKLIFFYTKLNIGYSR